MNSIQNHRTGQRRFLRLLLLLGMLLLLLIPMTNVEASAKEETGQKSVQVSFDYTEKCYPVRITVSGNGTLIDGKQSIRNGTLEYELLPGTVKWFEIKPDKNHTLEDLFVKNVETGERISIRDTIVDGRFSVMIEKQEIVIEVIFSTKDNGTGATGKENGSDKGSSAGKSNHDRNSTGRVTNGKKIGSTGTKTMDMAMTAQWMFVCFLTSTILMLNVIKRKRKYF